MDSVLAHMVALVLGSTLASLIYEGIAGNRTFSLSFMDILVVTLVGTLLSLWFGWTSTLTILGLYTAYSVAGGLMDRFPEQVEEIPGPAPPAETPSPELEADGPSPEERRAQALESGEITDITFRTELPLLEIAEALGLEDAELDGESYWEWVIGSFGRVDLDITRTPLKPALEQDTRLFLVSGGTIADDLKRQLVERLRPHCTGPIKCGQSIYLRGNEFDFVTVEEY